MPSKRGIARESARAVAGVAGIAVAALAIAGATWLPLSGFSVTPPSSIVTPVPTDQERTCPGPLLTLASDSTEANGASAFAAPTLTYGTDATSGVRTRPLTPSDDTTGERDGTPVTISVPTPTGAATPPLIAGAQSQHAVLEDFAGLAAASCDEASTDSWLVAGATTLGQTSLVLLSNPSTVQATVDLSVFSETGTVEAPGSSGILVPAGTQKIIPLAGLAPSAVAPVVHVVSQGGSVVASMEQSSIVGIDPRGMELTGSTATPAAHQVIPGVVIRSLDALEAAQSGESYGSDLPAVRVLVPGDKDATVSVGATGETGTALGNSYSATLKHGVVTEIPLDHLGDGNFTMTIDSTEPVVAAARTTLVSTDAYDFAWFNATSPVADKLLVAIPPGPGSVLHVASSGEESPGATVKVTLKGAARSLKVPGGGSASIAMPSAGVYTVTGASGLYASVSMAGTGQLTSFAIAPPGPLAAPIEVYPR